MKRSVQIINILIRVLLVIALLGCGGSTSNPVIADVPPSIVDSVILAPLTENPPVNIPTLFIFDNFANKIFYRVESSKFSEMRFYVDGNLREYDPNASHIYREGAWTIHNGQLITSIPNTYPREQTVIYTLLYDDKHERYYSTSQLFLDGTVTFLGFFYDQITNIPQARHYVGQN